MKNENITIDDLAAMVKRGFDETAKKDDLDMLKKDVGLLKKDVGLVKLRVENIERLLLKQHSEQLESLETRVKRLENLYAIKFQ